MGQDHANPDDTYDVLVKYNSSGIAEDAHSSVNGGASGTIFYSVAVDSTNAVYAAGGIAGPGEVDFGNNVTVTGTEVPTSGWSTLLVKYR